MKKQIIVFVLVLSISFLSMYMHKSEAQNATNNASKVATNLTVAAQNATNNASNVATNLTESANETLTGLGQSLSAFAKSMNISLQSENSSVNQLGKNASDPVLEMLNNTGNTSK